MKTLMKNIPDIEGFVVVPPLLLSWIRFFDGYEQRKEEKRHSRS
jgi:hypothetical protein